MRTKTTICRLTFEIEFLGFRPATGQIGHYLVKSTERYPVRISVGTKSLAIFHAAGFWLIAAVFIFCGLDQL
jgi:hypothetical protein